MARLFLVPSRKIETFESDVKKKYPDAKVSEGRILQNRDDSINGQYFYVTVPGVDDKDIKIEAE